jgi:acyl carrier protein
MSDIREKIVGLIAEVNPSLELGPEDDTRLLFDFGLDSLDHATILLELEEEFGFKVPDEKTESLVTIRAIAEFVARATGAAA